MHNAPPVVFPVGRFVWGAWVMGCLAALGALGLACWQWLAELPWAFMGWAWGAWGLCTTVAFLWKSGQPLGQGQLFWTGEAWFWQDTPANTSGQALHGPVDPLMVSVAVRLDLAGVMLLAVQPFQENGQRTGPLRHVWLQKNSMPSKWHGFRCAVYSRPKAMRDPASSLRVRF